MRSNLSILFVFGAMLVFSFAEELFGSWADVPLEEIVQNSPVVVVGKIEKIDPAEPWKEGMRNYDTAYITVSKVLKNTLKDTKITIEDKIPLSMPAIIRQGISGLALALGTDIRYRIGQEGIWILELKDNTFWATYPKDYQPLKKIKEIQDIILRKKN